MAPVDWKKLPYPPKGNLTSTLRQGKTTGAQVR
jgi:hypothetical protein